MASIERLQQTGGLIRFTGNLHRLTIHIQAADPTGRRYQLRDLRAAHPCHCFGSAAILIKQLAFAHEFL